MQKCFLEYETLREEILQKTELHNKLLTFSFTAILTIITFALAKNELEGKERVLLLFFSLVTNSIISLRITQYRNSIAKISAYIIVFLEKDCAELNWETRNRNVIPKTKRKYITLSSHYGSLALSVLCYLLYFYYSSDEFDNYFFILAPTIFILIEIYMAIIVNSINVQREIWIKRWEKYEDFCIKINDITTVKSDECSSNDG